MKGIVQKVIIQGTKERIKISILLHPFSKQKLAVHWALWKLVVLELIMIIMHLNQLL